MWRTVQDGRFLGSEALILTLGKTGRWPKPFLRSPTSKPEAAQGYNVDQASCGLPKAARVARNSRRLHDDIPRGRAVHCGLASISFPTNRSRVSALDRLG